MSQGDNRRLSEAQKRALLKLPGDGSEIRWEDGRAEVSLYAMQGVVKGDPKKQIATTYSLTEVAPPAIVDGKWDRSRWRATPLGLAVRAILKGE